MIAKISLPQPELKEVLDSLHQVSRGEDDISMDLNLIADPEEGVKIYVRNFNTLQVSHEISDFSHLDVTEYAEFVFNSETLHSLVKDADSNEITLEFSRDEFFVAIGNGYFATPTRFDLNLVQASEFQHPLSVDDFFEVAEIDRKDMLNTLKMMGNISPVVEVEIMDNELWVKVSDVVQGEGVVMQLIEDKDVPNLSFKYPNRPLRDFLKQTSGEKVKLFMTETGTIKLESRSGITTSRLMRAERIDDL